MKPRSQSHTNQHFGFDSHQEPIHTEFEALNRLWKEGIEYPSGEDLAMAYQDLDEEGSGLYVPTSYLANLPDHYD